VIVSMKHPDWRPGRGLTERHDASTRDPDLAATGSTGGETLQGHHVSAEGSIASSSTPG
jgi:hypothetical protein